jgi:hypothetical protein
LPQLFISLNILPLFSLPSQLPRGTYATTPLLNILNEACYGIKIKNFENSIQAKKQKVIDLLDRISTEEGKSEVVLCLDDHESTILENSFEEVFRQIDELEFQTRIGISRQKAQEIKEKLK